MATELWPGWLTAMPSAMARVAGTGGLGAWTTPSRDRTRSTAPAGRPQALQLCLYVTILQSFCHIQR
jgi:hypothetical protein